MISRALFGVGAICALALIATGCGGGGSSSSSGSTAATTTTAVSQGEAGGGPASSGALTPPGTKLGVGETATVTYVPFEEEEKSGEHQGIEAKVTVTTIEEKSQGDLSGIELEPEEKEKTPYFVKAKVEAVGSEEPAKEENPADRLEAIDDRGQEAPSLTVLGEFGPCEESEPPDRFVEGASYETCLIYLVREGGSVAEVKWDAGPTEKDGLSEYFEHPVTWSAGG